MNGRGEWAIVSKMMAILSLLLCDPSAYSRELFSPESSDYDLDGVILEKKKHAKLLISYLANRNFVRSGQETCYC